MKKSILIFGKQGSGKSEKLKSLSNNPEFKDSIFIDELNSILHFESVVNRIISDKEHFIISTDIFKETLPNSIISNFDVIELIRTFSTCR